MRPKRNEQLVQPHTPPTAVVRAPGGRLVELDLGRWNELPPLLVSAGWVIVKDLRKQP